LQEVIHLFLVFLWRHRAILECIDRNVPFKGTTSRFAYLEKFSLKFSCSSFIIRVNLLHPLPSLFFYGLWSCICCFSILVNYYFQVSFNLKVILYAANRAETAESFQTVLAEFAINGTEIPCYLKLRTGFN